MKIKELIKQLKEYNPDVEVVFSTIDNDYDRINIHEGVGLKAQDIIIIDLLEDDE